MHPRRSVLPAALIFLAPAIAAAADGGERSGAPLPNLASGIGEMFVALFVVIAVLLATLWAIKRLTLPTGGSRRLGLLGSLAVGPRERVVLVSVADEVLVLGVGGGGVRTLRVLPADKFGSEVATPPVAGGDFAHWLKKHMERRSDG